MVTTVLNIYKFGTSKEQISSLDGVYGTCRLMI